MCMCLCVCCGYLCERAYMCVCLCFFYCTHACMYACMHLVSMHNLGQNVCFACPSHIGIWGIWNNSIVQEVFYLTTHSTHFIYGYMASDIW